MQLKSLSIRRWAVESNLEGSVEFFTAEGEIKLTIRPEHMKHILDIVAEAIIQNAKAVAQDLTAEIIQSGHSALSSKELKTLNSTNAREDLKPIHNL